MRALTLAVVTPALSGNVITAERWVGLLRELGHRVSLSESWDGGDEDVLLALHARRSHPSIVAWRGAHPERPLIVALTGTDLYRDIHTDADAQESLELADVLVSLQPRAADQLPERLRSKHRAILQSAIPALDPEPPRDDVFEVCVVANMRPVKDPFLAADAVTLLPDESPVRVVHAGGILDEELRARAEAEHRDNPRWEWLGELSRGETDRLIARCRLLALTSVSEGGANVVSEAIVAGTPVVSTRIDGSVGLLGDNYSGYVPVGDAGALAAMLGRCAGDRAFLGELADWCKRLAPLLTPESERDAWRELLAELPAG